ncbi:DegT/DnrJ/EryC1/StrS family aminotransferase [Pelagibacteraceae bacterium]|jgi:perosamine synthetase|nr:DegT/DnrJ/EryC1/StrS family aminotransferase [Pelagibacteraceae bacterium]
MKVKLKLKNNFIPVNTPKIFGDEKKYVNDSLNTGWISSEGPYVKKFENLFSSFNKRKYGIAVSSGTAALEIALKSLNLKKNDEVIIPTFTIISSAMCVFKEGVKPVLVDSNINNWNMSVEQTINKITKNTKAIIITHIYGFPVDMYKILSIAKKKKITIIEDAAEMIGQKYNGKICGSFGDISTFSFYANKHITTGEGGMIVTNNKKIFEKCKSLRNLCFGIKGNRFNHEDIGWNYRFTNVQAAIGLGQLKNIKWIVNRKKEIGIRYYNNLKMNKNIIIQKPKKPYSENIYWVFGILLTNKYKNKRDLIVKKLLKSNIQTRNFFFPMHKQKILIKKKFFKKNMKFPVAEYLSKSGFYLPSGLGITNKEIDFVSDKVNKIIY